jgi:hypothetical protein
MKFSAKYDCTKLLRLKYNNKDVVESKNVKFLGMIHDNTISWKKHIESLKGKLNKACYIIRKAKQYINSHAFKMIYYAFFLSILTYGLIFWDNSTNSSHVFKLQKRVVRIMVGAPKRVSCKKNLDPYKFCHYPPYIFFFMVTEM